MGKLDHLESLRGLAALTVVLSHCVWAFAPPPLPVNREGRIATGSLEWPAGVATLNAAPRHVAELAYWPVKMGALPVAVFFVLSGIVLSQSYLRRGQVADLQNAAARRHLRLALPAVASSVLAWGLWKLGWIDTTATAASLRAAGLYPQWLDSFHHETPGLRVAVIESGFDLYFRQTPARPETLHNPVLWTMRVEFFGSLAVFAFLALFGLHRRALGLALALGTFLGLLGYLGLSCFLAGVAVALVRKDHPNARLPTAVGLALVASGITLAGWYGGYDGRERFLPVFKTVFHAGEVRYNLSAMAIVAAVALTPALGRALSWRPLVWLGGVSFGVYLVHLLVILSLGGYLVRTFTPDPAYGWANAMAMAIGASVAVSLLAGWLMTRLVDRPAVWLGKRVARLVVGGGIERDSEASRERERPEYATEPAVVLARSSGRSRSRLA